MTYEMGLGKTVIGIAAAEKLFDAGEINCCVIVCPASLKHQWAQRIEQFTDYTSWDCIVIEGTPAQRKELYNIVANGVKYVVMSYEMVINDAALVAKIKPGMVILDEATAIKTFRAKRTKQIKKLLRAKYRLALTGTPIENRPDEVFSIMQWVDDTILGRYDLFDKAYIRRNHYGWVVAYKNLPVLKKKLSAAMSRKSREDPDVKPYLPEVDTSEWYSEELPPKVKKLYKKIAEDILAEMEGLNLYSDFSMHDYYQGNYTESTPAGKMMGMYMCLEMLLDHPDLIIISAKNGAKYADEIWQAGLLDDITESPKLDKLVTKVREILAFSDDSRVLVYSFFRGMQDIIEDALEIPCVHFHGGLTPAAKSDAVARFTDADGARVFLSSHAGAYGMDMSMANYLVNYDHTWSSGKADQINGRHVRVSSEFDKVFVCNMLIPDTIEPWKLRKQERKRRVASAVMDGTGQDEFGRVEIDGDSLKDHLLWVVKNW